MSAADPFRKLNEGPHVPAPPRAEGELPVHPSKPLFTVPLRPQISRRGEIGGSLGLIRTAHPKPSLQTLSLSAGTKAEVTVKSQDAKSKVTVSSGADAPKGSW